MKLVRYSPPMLAPQGLHQMFDRFDDELFGELGDGLYAPAVDVRESAEAYSVQLEVPGIRQENLSLELLENVLTIRGMKEQAPVEGRYRRVERSYGRFARSISLARNVDGDGVTAHLADGILDVRLPKTQTSRARNIAVTTTVETQPEKPEAQPETAQGPQGKDAPEGSPS